MIPALSYLTKDFHAHTTDILGHLPAGRVLDVATGSGGFIHFLLEGLKKLYQNHWD